MQKKFQDIINMYNDCNDLGNAERSLDALSEELTASELIEVVELAIPEGYNAFDLQAVKDVVDLVGKHHTYYLGREGSPVIYIRPKVRFWVGTDIVKACCLADEASFEENGTLRLWWD